MSTSAEAYAELELGLHRVQNDAYQVEPGESSLADVEKARAYLDKYFGNDRSNTSEPEIDIYWGSAADFLRELRDKMQEFADEEPLAASEEEDDDDGFF